MTNGYIDINLLSANTSTVGREFMSLIDFFVQAAEVGSQKPSMVPFVACINKVCEMEAADVKEVELRDGHATAPSATARDTSYRGIAQPSRVLFVGDSYSKDVLGARQVGMNGAWLIRESEAAKETVTSMLHANDVPVHSDGNGSSGNIAPPAASSHSAALHDEYQSRHESIEEVKLHSLQATELAAFIAKLNEAR